MNASVFIVALVIMNAGPSHARVSAQLAPRVPSCFVEPMRTTGTVYYYCDCGAGADAACGAYRGKDKRNACTRATSPCRSGWQAKYRTLRAGETVALCRGGAFTADNVPVNNTKCTAASTCDLRDYTPPAAPAEWATDQTKRPVIAGGQIGRFYANDTAYYRGFRYWNLQVVNAAGSAFFPDGSVTDVDICNLRFSGSTAIYWGDVKPWQPSAARWTLRNSRIESVSKGQGILGGCDDCVIDGNYFANDSYGFNNWFDHPIYLTSSHSGVNRTVTGMRVTNNEIHVCRPGTVTGTVALVVHGSHRDLVIENNLIQCDNPAGVHASQWGISLGHGGYPVDVPSGYFHAVIRRNRIIDHRGYGIEISQAPDAVIEGNVIVMPTASDGDTAIATGTYGDRAGVDDPDTTRATIRNNTIFFRGRLSTKGIAVLRHGDGHIVTNNAIYGSRGSLQCFNFPLAAGAYELLSNNACNGTWGTTYDAGRVTLTKSPFVEAGADFTPVPPLVDAGTTTSYSDLATGSPSWSATDPGKPRDARPDIGAFER